MTQQIQHHLIFAQYVHRTCSFSLGNRDQGGKKNTGKIKQV